MNLVQRIAAPVIGISLAALITWLFVLWAAPIPVDVYGRKSDKLFVAPGDHVTISWYEDRLADCQSTAYRQLITADRKVITFEPSRTASRDTGTHQGTFDFIVPPLATPGKLTYRVKAHFECNWVQRLFGGPWMPLQDIELEYVMPMRQGLHGYDDMEYRTIVSYRNAFRLRFGD